MAVPTVDDVQQYLLQIEDSNTAEIAVLTAVLPRAITIVERAIGQMLAVENFTFNSTTPADSENYVYTMHNYPYVYLPPIQGAITSVAYESGFNQWTTIDAANYTVRDGQLWFNAIPTPKTYLRITAPWGYGDCPADVAEVMIETAINIWRSKDKGGFAEMIGESGNSYLRTVASLTKAQQAVLQAYTDQYRTICV